jgi:histone H3/H4
MEKATKVSDNSITLGKQPAGVARRYGGAVRNALGRASVKGSKLNKTALLAALTVKGSKLTPDRAKKLVDKVFNEAAPRKVAVANPFKNKTNQMAFFDFFKKKESSEESTEQRLAREKGLQQGARNEVTGRAVGEARVKRDTYLQKQNEAGKIDKKFQDMPIFQNKTNQLSGKALGETTQISGKVEAGIFDVARSNVERIARENGMDNKVARNMINTLADLSLNQGIQDRQALEVAFKESMQAFGNDAKAISRSAKELNISKSDLQDAVKKAQGMSIDNILGKTNSAFQASVEYFPSKTLAATHKVSPKIMDLVGNNFRDMLYNKNMSRKDMAAEFDRTNNAMAQMEQDKPKAFANKAKEYGLTPRELSDSVRRLQKLSIDDLLH